MSIEQLLPILNSPMGLAVLLLLALIGLHRKWWVPGWLYTDKAAEADKWQELAWRSANNTDKALDITKGPP